MRSTTGTCWPAGPTHTGPSVTPHTFSSLRICSTAPSSLRSCTQSNPLLEAVERKERMLAVTTDAVLFLRCVHIARLIGINIPSINGIFLMKNISTVNICST